MGKWPARSRRVAPPLRRAPVQRASTSSALEVPVSARRWLCLQFLSRFGCSRSSRAMNARRNSSAMCSRGFSGRATEQGSKSGRGFKSALSSARGASTCASSANRRSASAGIPLFHAPSTLSLASGSRSSLGRRTSHVTCCMVDVVHDLMVTPTSSMRGQLANAARLRASASGQTNQRSRGAIGCRTSLSSQLSALTVA